MPRELIDTGRDKRFVRRDAKGQFEDVVDVGKSLSQDRKRKAKRTVKAGEGDRGDQKPRSAGRKATASKSRTTRSKKTVSPAKQSVKKGARTKRSGGKGRSSART